MKKTLLAASLSLGMFGFASLAHADIDAQIKTLIAAAEKARPELTSLTEHLAKAHGCKALIGPTKKFEKIQFKLKKEYTDEAHPHGDITKVVDVCRSTVVCAHNANVVTAGKGFPAEGKTFTGAHAKVTVIRNKDRWTKPTTLGYRDFLFNVKMSDGATCEIQVNTQPMIDAKEGEGHKMYDEIEKLMAGAKGLADVTMIMEKVLKLTDASKTHYEAAYKKGEKP